MKVRKMRSSDGTDFGALSLERIGRRRAAIAGFAGTRYFAAVATAALLALSPTITTAQDADPADAEFIELLEYVGSWEGAEEDWVLFLGDASDPDSPTDVDLGELTSEAAAGGLESTRALPADQP